MSGLITCAVCVDLQEELEVTVCLGSSEGIGNTCRLPIISTHVERESIDTISGGFGDVIGPSRRGIRVCLLVSTTRSWRKNAYVADHVVSPDIFGVGVSWGCFNAHYTSGSERSG